MISGFENENEIINEFVNKSNFQDLNNNLKKVVLVINNGKIPYSFSAKKYGGTSKADLSIIINGKEFNVSVKKGSGNSLHQEPIEDFIFFLNQDIENNQSVFNDLRYFVWGDGTIDGTGKVKDRVSATELKKSIPIKINNIQNYFNKHKFKLTNRFIVDGAVSKQKADFILFGDINKCIIVEEKKVVQFVNKEIKKPLSIGVLTFQAWNRNLSGRVDMENRRGQIQLKWGSMERDLNILNNE